MAAATQNPIDTPASEFAVQRLLDTDLVRVRQVDCRGTCRHRSAEECASQTHFVFPFRGVYLRHVGRDQAVADAVDGRGGTAPVVDYVELERLGAITDYNLGAGGARMLDDVRQRLLHDPVGGEVDPGRNMHGLPLEPQLHREP
jgi:hypothetical protein